VPLCEIKVKIILIILCFLLFTNVFVLKRENKKKEKVLSNKHVHLFQ
jgi:hypothetical protein